MLRHAVTRHPAPDERCASPASDRAASFRGSFVPRRSRIQNSATFPSAAHSTACAVNLDQAKTAASALFDKLEKYKDGTLDRKELQGRIPDAEWAVADPDNDKTISKDEYLAYVEAAFKKADTDNDGTLDARELKTPAGHALVRLLMK